MAAPQEETVVELAQGFIGEDVELSRLDQISDLQRLMGPVIAYKILLEIAINSGDAKERRMAAAKILDASTEDPERIAERLRSSIFRDVSIEELQAVVDTGITDPEKAVAKLKSI